MVNNKKNHALLKSLLLMITLLFTVTDATAQPANITVTSSRNPIALDSSFHLIYEADSSVDDDPDFSPINQKFDILSSSQSTNMRSINGSWSMKKSWNLTLIAKETGKFTIPAIAFGTDLSPAIQLTVSNGSSPNSASPDGQATVPAKIFLESTIDKKTGWVQSQFIYTIRLLRTVNITGAYLTDPETSDSDAIIERISEDQYQTTRNGISYEVIERRYVIFPQKSGTLKINPITFEGRVNSTQPRTIFDQFRMSGQLKRLRSNAVKVTVNAAPASINLQDWLPAINVQLIDEWSDDIQNIKTGEPVTRTITIVAQGLTSAQLAELNFTETSDLKQYPDKPVSEDRKEKNGITGLKQIKVALIPAQAGTYTLPEVKLQWWNTKTNKAETATIPPVMITATGNAATNTVSNNTTNKDNRTSSATDQLNKQLTDTTIAPAPQIINQPYWRWLTIFFATAWLLTLLLLIKIRKTGGSPKIIKHETNTASLRQSIFSVKKYAKKNDAESTKNALIEWAQIFYADSTISNLSLITDHCSGKLCETIEELRQSLYSPEKPDWHGKALLNAFKKEQSLSSIQKNQAASALKPLYNH